MADLDRIRRKCTDAEREELDVLATAVERTLAAYQKHYAESDLRKWTAAKNAMAEFTAALEAKYFPAERCFKHRKEACDWLIDEGYKVGKSKFYADCDRGECVVEGDGTVRESALIAYAKQHLRQITDGNGDLTPLTEEKTRLEIENLKAKNERAIFELEKERGKYIPRREFNQEINARFRVLDQTFENLIRVRMADVVSMVGGDPKKVNLAIDFFMAEKNETMSVYGNTEHFQFIDQAEEVN